MSKKWSVVSHPFWDEVKVKKGTKIPGADLKVRRIYVPNDKYFDFMLNLFKPKKEVKDA